TILIDAAYAVVSVAALVGLLAHNVGPRWPVDEFRRKCETDITQTMLRGAVGGSGGAPPSSDMAATMTYRDSFTIKYYSPELWCNVSWMLGTLLSNKWHIL
ncbi:hypothetical protein IW150_007476, partial [Coemansia sp. RSA 2607]